MKKSLPPERIEFGRIVLRRHSLDLAPLMFQYVEQDRERLREFLPFVDSTRSVEEESQYIQMTLEKWDGHELFDYGIFRAEDGLYLGNCGVHAISWQHDRCAIGYWILGEHEGKGYVSETVKGLEKIFFGLGFNRIEIHCSSANLRSAHVPRANGYVHEGTQRQDTVENGEYRDTLIFAKIKSDFAKMPAPRPSPFNRSY